ncbi:MAG: PKD domain-containing protein, partial [Nitrospirae bacterium]|nr:PKD domain-containing protein [Nitrospirota bacterium]
IAKWGSQGNADSQFNNPIEAAVDVSGNVYVTDWNNNRIQKFNSNGTFTTKWGSLGNGDGQFKYPVGVAVDATGNVYVVDYGNYRVQKFAKDGGGSKIVNPGNNHTYQRIDKQMTWPDAKVYCENLGGYLATVTSDSENKFLIDKLLPADFFDSTNNSCWLGATDVETEGTWKWVTGEKWDFTSWAFGEPNNEGGNENCLLYYSKYGHIYNLWNDGSCSNAHLLICEWNPTPTQVKLTVTKQGTAFDTVTTSTGLISWNDNTVVASYGSGGCTGPGCTLTQTGTAYYNSGANVTLTATEVSGSKFTGWGGDCTTASVNPTCTLERMSANKNITATFTASLQPSPQIVGTVHSKLTPQSEWTPSKATVTLKSVDGTSSQSYTTKDDGYYTFNGLSTGTYNILARSNEKSAMETVTINPTTGMGSTIYTNTIQTRDLRMTNNAKPLIYVPGVMGTSDMDSQVFGWSVNTLKVKLPPDLCTSTDNLQVFDPVVRIELAYLVDPFYCIATELVGTKTYCRVKPVDFEKFKEFFENNGFKVYLAKYDWRLSLDDTKSCPGGKKPWENYLKPVIDNAKKETGYQKVYVVGHSMGGLLTRTYIQDSQYSNRNDIEKFVMFGTPNEGSANAYYSWEGGDPLSADILTKFTLPDRVKLKFTNMYYDSTIANCDSMSKSCKTYSERKKFIRENIKGLGNLFPTYPFLEVWKDNVNEPPVTPVPTNSPAYNIFLNKLNGDTNKSRMKANCSSDNVCVPTKLFMTNDQETINYIRVKLGYLGCVDYEDGCPTSIIQTDGTEPGTVLPHIVKIFPETATIYNGDGTVVPDRAKETFNDINGKPSIDYEEGSFTSHGTMPSSELLQKKILTYLNPNSNASSMQSVTKYSKRDTAPTTTLSFYLTGGVQPYMTDPQKRTEGVNFTTSQVEQNIPDTTLKLLGNSSSIFINNPVNGTYTIDLKGNAGLFTVNAVSFNLANGLGAETTKNGFYKNGIFNLWLTLDTNSGVLTITSKVAPPTDVKAQNNGGKTRLTWTPSATASVIGYNIYGKTFDQDGFTILASTGKDTTSFDTGKDWASSDTATVWYYVVTAFDSDVTESLWDTTVSNTNPIKADFNASKTTVAVNTPVSFSDLSTGNITSWQWDFENDGVIDSTSQNPTHTYTFPGTYSVNLYVKDSDGKTDYTSKGAYITVTSTTSKALGKKVNLDGDGKSDILWRDATTGDVVAWLMDGTVIKSGGYLAKGVPNNWHIVAIGDLNGDGKSDILWQDTTTGDVAAWLMDGTKIISGGYLAKGIPNNWHIVAIGDLDGDGKSDLLWRDATTGDVAAWLMDGTKIISGGYLAKGVPNNWQIVAIGDLNGDGKSDLVWQNTTTGDVAAWLIDGTVIKSGGYLAKGVPNNWQIQ